MTAKKVQEINNFKQRQEEMLYLAWDRFKELLYKCPQHYLTDMQVVIAFYMGLDVATRMILDSQSFIPKMNAKDALTAIQERADHYLRWYDGAFKRHTGNDDSEILATITVQINNLGREIKKLNERIYAIDNRYKGCNGPHSPYPPIPPLKKEVYDFE